MGALSRILNRFANGQCFVLDLRHTFIDVGLARKNFCRLVESSHPGKLRYGEVELHHRPFDRGRAGSPHLYLVLQRNGLIRIGAEFDAQQDA